MSVTVCSASAFCIAQAFVDGRETGIVTTSVHKETAVGAGRGLPTILNVHCFPPTLCLRAAKLFQVRWSQRAGAARSLASIRKCRMPDVPCVNVSALPCRSARSFSALLASHSAPNPFASCCASWLSARHRFSCDDGRNARVRPIGRDKYDFWRRGRIYAGRVALQGYEVGRFADPPRFTGPIHRNGGQLRPRHFERRRGNRRLRVEGPDALITFVSLEPLGSLVSVRKVCGRNSPKHVHLSIWGKPFRNVHSRPASPPRLRISPNGTAVTTESARANPPPSIC